MGYLTLCATALNQGDVPEAASKHVPRHPPVSATLIADSPLPKIIRDEVWERSFNLVQRRNRQMARLFDDLRRSRALTMLAQLRSEGLLTDEEFSMFSQETRRTIEALLGAR